jgi:pimeloyl-ACP methyl ester carboxylesterase
MAVQDHGRSVTDATRGEMIPMRVIDRYRRDMRAAWRRLASLEREVVRTPFGKIEYIDHGEGPVVLVVHGITQGADGGLRELAADIVPAGYRVIVPSRFGYLGSEMPNGATPEMQADAFAALLDAIGVRKVLVLAGSAGSTSALHFAIRHHDRTRALLLVSANVPGPHQSRGMPPRAVFRAIFADDPVLWLIITYLPDLMARLSQVLRVSDGVQPTEEDEEKIRRAMEGVLLGKLRVTGEVFDAFVSNPNINQIELSDVPVPTMIVHARDDNGPPYQEAAAMAKRIPCARLVTVDHGGHLMLGSHPAATLEVEAFLEEFLGEHRPAMVAEAA